MNLKVILFGITLFAFSASFSQILSNRYRSRSFKPSNGINQVVFNSNSYKTGENAATVINNIVKSVGTFSTKATNTITLILESNILIDTVLGKSIKIFFYIITKNLRLQKLNYINSIKPDFFKKYGERFNFNCGFYLADETSGAKGGFQDLYSFDKNSQSFEITSVDYTQRKVSGTYNIIGKLADNTPINLNGTFTDISY